MGATQADFGFGVRPEIARSAWAVDQKQRSALRPTESKMPLLILSLIVRSSLGSAVWHFSIVELRPREVGAEGIVRVRRERKSVDDRKTQKICIGVFSESG
jgi:hypothetical protein